MCVACCNYLALIYFISRAILEVSRTHDEVDVVNDLVVVDDDTILLVALETQCGMKSVR